MSNQLEQWSSEVRRFSPTDLELFEDVALIEQGISQVDRTAHTMRIQSNDILARGRELCAQIEQSGMLISK